MAHSGENFLHECAKLFCTFFRLFNGCKTRNCRVEGPTVIIPLRNMNVQFDPGNLQPFDDLGAIYPNIRISDDWGILTVSKGALMSSNWTKIVVSALYKEPESIDTNLIEGDGWKLGLNDGWKLIPSERKGDYLLRIGDLITYPFGRLLALSNWVSYLIAGPKEMTRRR